LTKKKSDHDGHHQSVRPTQSPKQPEFVPCSCVLPSRAACSALHRSAPPTQKPRVFRPPMLNPLPQGPPQYPASASSSSPPRPPSSQSTSHRRSPQRGQPSWQRSRVHPSRLLLTAGCFASPRAPWSSPRYTTCTPETPEDIAAFESHACARNPGPASQILHL